MALEKFDFAVMGCHSLGCVEGFARRAGRVFVALETEIPAVRTVGTVYPFASEIVVDAGMIEAIYLDAIMLEARHRHG